MFDARNDDEGSDVASVVREMKLNLSTSYGKGAVHFWTKAPKPLNPKPLKP